MKIYEIGTTILVALVIVFGLTRLPLRSFEVRPIKIQVIDEVTKEPVKGAVVYYVHHTYYAENILGLPLIDPVYNEWKIAGKTITDSEGMVYIPKRKARLRLYEYFSTEYIYINLDTEVPLKKTDDFFSVKNINPISHLKGIIISSFTYDYAVQKQTEDDKPYRLLSTGASLLEESYELVVELERW